MKKILLTLIMPLLSMGIFAQHAPVAVDDYVVVPLEDSVTFHVLQNDYHPDSVPFRIYFANGIFTDSTITVYLDYLTYWNFNSYDTIHYMYQLIDDNGNSGQESVGNLYITIENSDNQSKFLDTNSIKARVQPAGFQFWKGNIINANPLAPNDVGFILSSSF